MSFVKCGTPALVLAPMEGVTDAPMRRFMGRRGGFTHFVTEFYRISRTVPRPQTLARAFPEFGSGCRTPDGTPVQVQFLGGDPDDMAEAASRAVDRGAGAIDINFGCPAPTVNRHDGGATLLKYPCRIEAIVGAVRRAVPPTVPVSAKLRLGWCDPGDIFEIAERAAAGGASWITIHGRTKEQGYRPPAHWEPIGEVRRRLAIPVVANGDIWTLEDFKRCREITGCEHFMIGRSALADPNLQWRIASELGLPLPEEASESMNVEVPWASVFMEYASSLSDFGFDAHHQLKRLKQWVAMVGIRFPDAWHSRAKRAQSLEEFFGVLYAESRAKDCTNELLPSLPSPPPLGRSGWHPAGQPRLPHEAAVHAALTLQAR